MVVYPVRRLQDGLIVKTLGAAAWARVCAAYDAEVAEPSEPERHAAFRDAGLQKRLEQLGLEIHAKLDPS